MSSSRVENVNFRRHEREREREGGRGAFFAKFGAFSFTSSSSSSSSALKRTPRIREITGKKNERTAKCRAQRQSRRTARSLHAGVQSWAAAGLTRRRDSSTSVGRSTCSCTRRRRRYSRIEQTVPLGACRLFSCLHSAEFRGPGSTSGAPCLALWMWIGAKRTGCCHRCDRSKVRRKTAAGKIGQLAQAGQAARSNRERERDRERARPPPLQPAAISAKRSCALLLPDPT